MKDDFDSLHAIVREKMDLIGFFLFKYLSEARLKYCLEPSSIAISVLQTATLTVGIGS